MKHTSHLTDKNLIRKLIRGRTPEQELEMLKKIKPLVLRDNVVLWEIAIPDNIRDSAFQWEPDYVCKADMSKLRLLAVITTYHSCGYIGVFKPDLGEVMSQIPDHLVDQTCAFEVVYDNVVTSCVQDTFYGHKAFTKLYTSIATPTTQKTPELDEGFI